MDDLADLDSGAAAPLAGPCGRCGQRYPRVDRRVQLRGGALCRSCHLDPGLRWLAISIPSGDPQDQGRVKQSLHWIRRTFRTVVTIIAKPAACFRAVDEPVLLTPWVAFLLTLAAPSWLGLVTHTAWTGLRRRGPRLGFEDPRWLDMQLGSAGVDALDLWTLALFPLGLLAAFFCTGTLAHLLVLLTGPSSRTLGASLRAMAISFVPLLMLSAPLELALRAGWVETRVWGVGVALAGLWSLGLLALGLSRSHHTALLRGWVAAPLPCLCVQLLIWLRAAFALGQAPSPLG